MPVEDGKGKKYKKKITEFIGYTYKPIEEPNSGLLKALIDLDSYKPSAAKSSLDYLQLEATTTADEKSSSTRFLKK